MAHCKSFTILISLCGFLFFFRLADRDLSSSHEARAAQNAQTILTDGAWALPHLLDRRVELQKPPLYYWLVALAAWWNDGRVDGWCVRLPAALSALGCVLLTFALGVWRGRPLAGFVAALVLATALHFTWLARVGRIDMPLAFAVSLTLAGFYTRRLLPAYLAVAVGVLLKGPIAVVLPAGGFLVLSPFAG